MSSPESERPVVLAVAAHPDDIEFYQAGTLLLLKEAGCAVHMWNLASGSLGSLVTLPEETARIRAQEARDSAVIAGAVWHPPICDDLEVFYNKDLLARTAAVIRTIRPQIVLTHSSRDYMEDHQNVCRLVVSAVFARSIPHFATNPSHPSYDKPVRIYHAPPHGLRDGYDEPFKPHLLVDVASKIDLKKEMLSCHRSQAGWLESTQGMASYVDSMESGHREMAKWGSGLEIAEAWRRHSHLGFCDEDFDPLKDLLKQKIQTFQEKYNHAKTN